MAKIQQAHGNLNDADALRVELDELEREMAAYRPAGAAEIVGAFGRARRLLVSLEAAGIDCRAERGRYASIGARLRRQAGRVVRECGGPGRYAALRAAAGAGEEEPDWRLDRIATARSHRIVMQSVSVVAAVGAVLLVGWLARDFLFPKDLVRDTVQAAASATRRNQPSEALAAVDASLALSPTNPTLLTWRGTLLPVTRSLESTAAYSQALQILGPYAFSLERAQVWFYLDNYEAALTDLNAAVGLAPRDPVPLYLRATAFEGLSQRRLAIADLERAAELATAAKNDYLYAQIKVRLGVLMQQSGGQ